jgi:hypothetical protein
VRARTVAPPGTEPVRWELLRFVLSHTYNFNNVDQPLGDVTADLIVSPNRYFAFRGESSYNVYGEGLQTLNTDVVVVTPPVLASLGTRYSEPTRVNFLQGNLTADVTRYVTARLSTNWDLRTNTVVENRMGVDVKFQCWAFTIEYVTRNRDEDEIRFSLNLLGVGTPLTSGFGFGSIAGASATGSSGTGVPVTR